MTNSSDARCLDWLILVVVLVSTLNAISKIPERKFQRRLELQWYMFAAVFMGCAGYALLRKEHIRIDIIASHLSDRANHRIALFGHIFFLMPLCVIMLYFSWPIPLESVRINEHSSNAGGLVRWPVKLIMIVGFALLHGPGHLGNHQAGGRDARRLCRHRAPRRLHALRPAP